MKIVTGDLLRLAETGSFDVIVHGCNCHCTMGKGIALSIKTQFPQAYEADLRTSKGDRSKLGTISFAEVTFPAATLFVVNAYTQFHYRGAGVLANYEAIDSAFRQVKNRFTNSRIGYPRIGAGLAKGIWTEIAKIIDTALAGEDHTLVEYAPISTIG